MEDYFFEPINPKKKDDDVEKETIKLYNLKYEYKSKLLENKEQKLVNKEEDINKNKYYRIDDKKRDELEKAFKQVKTIIKLSFNLKKLSEEHDMILPDILFDIKKGEKNKNILILYNNKHYSKLIEIEISGYISCVEKLENNDLIFLVYNENQYEILVYRYIQELKKEKKGYFLNQKIKETFEGYEIKYKKKKNYHFLDFEDEKKEEPIMYNLYYIKAISKNRFFCVSNYGFKLYALNEKNEYELVLLESYEKIDFIYEIDTYKFIFGLNLRKVKGYGFCGNAYTCYYNLFLNKIELKNINKKENKSLQEKSNDYKKNKNNGKNSDNLYILKMREKLKFSFISQTMFEFSHSSPLVDNVRIYFSDFVTLKNKFFIIMVKKTIFIFNMENGKKIKKFEIIVDYNFKMDIKKWDCRENDEFILIVGNNVILFKLNEENSSKISLNILNYAYFPELCIKYNEDNIIIKGLKKIHTQKNRFYSYTDKSNNIFIY